MARATGLILSSHYEGFPTVLVEALAAGTAVISTNCPFGPSEILEGGRYGILVPPGDTAAMANAMTAIVERDPETARRAAEDGLKRANQFTAEASSRKYTQLIETVLTTQTGRASRFRSRRIPESVNRLPW